MTNIVKTISEFFALSLCAWGVIYILFNFSIKRFIVKRYKLESGLIETTYFKKHAVFVRHLPDFFSAGFFAIHLLLFVWGWKFVKFIKERRPNVTYFDDIENPEYVTKHFSDPEIRRAKWMLFSGLIMFAHGIAYYILRAIWPDAFS